VLDARESFVRESRSWLIAAVKLLPLLLAIRSVYRLARGQGDEFWLRVASPLLDSEGQAMIEVWRRKENASPEADHDTDASESDRRAGTVHGFRAS